MVESTGPSLHAIKPGFKSALPAEDAQSFELALANEVQEQDLSLHFVDEGIYYIDGVLSKQECSRFRATVDDCSTLTFWNSNGRNDEVRSFRDADTIEIYSDTIAQTIWGRMEHLWQGFHINIVSESDVEWERELMGEWQASAINKNILFAKYPHFGSFAPHTDGRVIQDFNNRSFYSVIIFLNDIPNDCGGSTKFYEKSAVIALQIESTANGTRWTASKNLCFAEVAAKAGRMLVFHQSLVHEGVSVSSPYNKYIIRTDVMYSRNPAVCSSETDKEAYRLFQSAELLAELGEVEESIKQFKRALKLSPEMARIMGHA